MAALRSGIKTVLIPADNVKDLEEIDQTVRAALHFVPVEQADAALAEALSLTMSAQGQELAGRAAESRRDSISSSSRARYGRAMPGKEPLCH